MGRYVTFDQVQARYPILSDEGISSVESTYIFFAENELDGMLSTHFTAPFSSDNITVRDLATDLTYLRISNLKVAEREAFKKMIDDRIARLKSGEENMITDGGGALQSVGETVYSNTKDYYPTFTMLDDIEECVDPDLIEDEVDERRY